MWTLLPALPRKWNVEGRAWGSDLGNNCFQYRFEREEDLRKVLDNRPYHFGYWMIILQRWEPVISSSFPSMIPFWIKIRGLPLHYWHKKVICEIGKDLGTLENHELTKTTARVQVSVDGLKNLIKDTIMDFESGEECVLTFEYERLENHCKLCGNLSHLMEDCPQYLQEDNHKVNSTIYPLREASQPPRISDRKQQERWEPTTRYIPPGQRERKDASFHCRLDRHGNPFGPRLETKQTRNPPPEYNNLMGEENPNPSRRMRDENPLGRQTTSPQYVHNREKMEPRQGKSRALTQNNKMSVWREKPASNNQLNEKEGLETHQTPKSVGQTSNLIGEQVHIPTTEEVLTEIQEATLQYISCADPKESAARKLRVIQSEARGDVERAAADIIATATARATHRYEMSPMTMTDAIPPQEIGTTSLAPIQAPLLLLGPGQEVESNDTTLLSATNPPQPTVGRKRGRPAKLKSAIVSPRNTNCTTGASSRKRILAHIQNSPGRQYTTTRGDRSRARKNTPRNDPTEQPQTILIPASQKQKQKQDFQEPLHPAP